MTELIDPSVGYRVLDQFNDICCAANIPLVKFPEWYSGNDRLDLRRFWDKMTVDARKKMAACFPQRCPICGTTWMMLDGKWRTCRKDLVDRFA